MSNFTLPENPKYNTEIPQIQENEPLSHQYMNPRLMQVLENIHSVKGHVDSLEIPNIPMERGTWVPISDTLDFPNGINANFTRVGGIVLATLHGNIVRHSGHSREGLSIQGLPFAAIHTTIATINALNSFDGVFFNHADVVWGSSTIRIQNVDLSQGVLSTIQLRISYSV